MLASASRVAGVILALAAAAACTNLDNLTEPDCAYAVSPTAIDVGSQGGNGTLTVSTPGVCGWTVETPADWVSFSGTRSGKGNASVAYAIGAHEGFDVRSATISVGGQSVRVSQAGRPIPILCSYAVTPTAWTYPWEGGQGSIAVAAQPGCAWTAVSQAAWMTITLGGRGSGTGTFGFSVAVNPMQVSRTGTLSVSGQTITITQARNNTGTNGKR